MKLPGSASFDLERFIANYSDRPDILREILRLYREEAPERLQTIRNGIARPDYATVARAAHSLANTCGTLESLDGVREARALELAARHEEGEAARVSAQSLEAIVAAMVAEIDEYLAREERPESGGDNGHGA